MTNELKQAMDAKAAAEAVLAEAAKRVREIAMANYSAARDAAIEAGVQLPALAKVPKASTSQKMSASMRATWAAKTPEQRATWLARMQAGRHGTNGSAEVQ